MIGDLQRCLLVTVTFCYLSGFDMFCFGLSVLQIQILLNTNLNLLPHMAGDCCIVRIQILDSSVGLYDSVFGYHRSLSLINVPIGCME